MLGDNLVDFIANNKKAKIQEAQDCLRYLRKWYRRREIDDPEEYSVTLNSLLKIINDPKPINKISLEEIGTTKEEIGNFETRIMFEF